MSECDLKPENVDLTPRQVRAYRRWLHASFVDAYERSPHPLANMPAVGSEHGWPELRRPFVNDFTAGERRTSSAARIVSVEHSPEEAR